MTCTTTLWTRALARAEPSQPTRRTRRARRREEASRTAARGGRGGRETPSHGGQEAHRLPDWDPETTRGRDSHAPAPNYLLGQQQRVHTETAVATHSTHTLGPQAHSRSTAPRSRPRMLSRPVLGRRREGLEVGLFLLLAGLAVLLLEAEYARQANQFQLEESNASSGVCALYPSALVGALSVEMSSDLTRDDVERELASSLQPGGAFQPESCTSRQKLVVIIPFRARWLHLTNLVRYLHPFLQRQQHEYRLVVVEQMGDGVFNKGHLMNLAAEWALRELSSECLVFHDVDLIPEDDRNVYACASSPRHLSPAVDELRYNLMYYDLVGGVLALSRRDWLRVNGFSNLFEGWGGEDDDMLHRIRGSGLTVSRPISAIGRYRMVRHVKREPWAGRYRLLREWQRYRQEGFNSIAAWNSTVRVASTPLYTNMSVLIGARPASPGEA